ncbi:hypothetical protein [Muricoccus radiodurans]|uniref:hypothetical protein n=1 Tax=Muricoccus radiodurans TaxID=2231721 RepID=UPI003CEC549B
MINELVSETLTKARASCRENVVRYALRHGGNEKLLAIFDEDVARADEAAREITAAVVTEVVEAARGTIAAVRPEDRASYYIQAPIRIFNGPDVRPAHRAEAEAGMPSVQENALRLLREFYDRSGGDTGEVLETRVIVEQIGMDKGPARAALLYLFGRGLAEDTREVAELPAAILTSAGVDAIEGARDNPQRATRDFPNLNISIVGSMYGSALQQGSHGSTQNSTQVLAQGLDLPQLAKELGELKALLRTEATTSDQFRALAEVAAAEDGAKAGDAKSTAGSLGKLGGAAKWVAGLAQKAGASVAAKAILHAAGLE